MDGGRWTVDGGRWTVDGGRWTVDGGRWTVDGGRWTVDGGQWMVDGGRWVVDVTEQMGSDGHISRFLASELSQLCYRLLCIPLLESVLAGVISV